MKPFDLQKALAGEPVVTRGGRKVEELRWYEGCSPDYPVRGTVARSVLSWTVKGEQDQGDESVLDLFMAEDEPERPDSMSLIAEQMREIREGYAAIVQLKDREIAHKDKIIDALIAELRRRGVEKFEHEGRIVTIA